MTEIELLKHVLANFESKRDFNFGLIYYSKPDESVDLSDIDWDNPEQYTLAPRTHTVNSFVVPAPESKPMVEGTDYYMPAPGNKEFASYNEYWNNVEHDLWRLHRGVIFTTKEAAQQNALAMLGRDPAKGVDGV